MRAPLPESQLAARDHHPLNFAGAFIDLRDLGVAEVALDRKLAAVTDSSMDLDGGVGAEHRRLRGEELRHGGFQGVALAGLLGALLGQGRLQDKQAAGLDTSLHVGQFESDSLELPDRLAEGLALPGVTEA